MSPTIAAWPGHQCVPGHARVAFAAHQQIVASEDGALPISGCDGSGRDDHAGQVAIEGEVRLAPNRACGSGCEAPPGAMTVMMDGPLS
jgi:hypothetical protein